ncbi:amidase signature domain-containing protein, partial [Stachybotrys elegans]
EVICATPSNDLPRGPYFLHLSGKLTRAYRLYEDFNMAFTQGLIEGPDGEFIPSLGAVGNSVHAAVSVPVPSRHYYPKPSPDKPLSGVRMGVKDIFDLEGTKTGAGSRAYFDLYPPRDTTASSVQRLIDLGAVVVGKLKTAQFATGERPTTDYVDQLAPFNPRGDGYQNPSASSCGIGAAMASYDWLDLGVGSDTGGSIRGPAMANGLFGMRSWFRPQSNYTSFPGRIILPEEFWPTFNSTSMPVFDKFINNLSTFLNATIERINTNDSYVEYTNSSGLQEFVGIVPVILLLDRWRGFGEKFVADYAAKFDRHPFLDPVPRNGLSRLPYVDPESYNQSIPRLMEYKDWYNSKIVTTCEDALVLYPMGPGREDYRDNALNSQLPPIPSTQDLQALQASAAGVPDYTIPLGVRRYNSKASLREEELPVSIGIIAGAGCDHMLVDLVAHLGDVIPDFKTTVRTGRTLW